jgi:hypothetical protein
VPSDEEAMAMAEAVSLKVDGRWGAARVVQEAEKARLHIAPVTMKVLVGGVIHDGEGGFYSVGDVIQAAGQVGADSLKAKGLAE